MVWCTCAEVNQSLYLERVAAWNTQLDDMEVNWDRYCIVDGRLIEDVSSSKFHDIRFITFEKLLGRITMTVFPGWRRSFSKAMEIAENYTYCVHIECDCFVVDRKGFITAAQTQDITTYPINSDYSFPEICASVWNNRDIRNKIKNFYKNESNLMESTAVERVLSENVASDVNLGHSVRLENPNRPAARKFFNYFCQCSPDMIKKFLEEQK